MELAVIFSHHDLSVRERELIYTLLSKTFFVVEEQLSFDDIEKLYLDLIPVPDYSTTLIDLIFPIKFDDNFFQIFNFNRWHSFKNIVKEIKYRRGKLPVVLLIQFKNLADKTDLDVIFSVKNELYRPFEMAIEKMEYLVDVVPTHLEILPPNTFELFYLYNDVSSKWVPYRAKSNTNNYINDHFFKDGKWNK